MGLCWCLWEFRTYEIFEKPRSIWFGITLFVLFSSLHLHWIELFQHNSWSDSCRKQWGAFDSYESFGLVQLLKSEEANAVAWLWLFSSLISCWVEYFFWDLWANFHWKWRVWNFPTASKTAPFLHVLTQKLFSFNCSVAGSCQVMWQ